MGYRARLVALTTITTFAVLVVVAALLLIGTRRMLYDDIDKAMQQRSRQTLAIYKANRKQLQDFPVAPGGAGNFTRVVSSNGNVVAPPRPPQGDGRDPSGQPGQERQPGEQGGGRERPIMPASVRREFDRLRRIQIPVTDDAARTAKATFGTSRFENVATSGIRFRTLTTATGNGKAVQFARPLDEADKTMARLRRLVAVGVVSGALLSLLAALLVTRLASRPIERLTDFADDIAESGDLTRRVPVSGPASDELSKLAHRFNAMLDALELAATKQRQLIDDASHELRTPLASLRMNLEVLMRARDKGATLTDELLADIIDQVDELTMLTRDLVDLSSSIESDAIAVPVSVDAIISEAVTRSARLHPDVRVRVSGDTSWQTRGSLERLTRVIGNLLENSAKFSGEHGTVEIESAPGTIAVIDHGVGVPDSERESIFDRFHRGANSTDVPGSGLGLAIVKEVVEHHGGSVTCNDTPGGGATFTIALPVDTDS